jgi:hypothetical protein
MMSRKLKELSTSEGRRKVLRRGRIFSLFLFAGGVGMILYGNASLRHDRSSLHWPTVPGVMQQVEWHYRGFHTSYSYVQATYSYIVNGTRYVSHQIRLWNSDLRSDLSGDVYAKPFAEAHPANSSIDVYYDPRNPDNAVLIPGADEFNDKNFIRIGCFVVIIITCQIIWYRKDYIRLFTQRRDDAAKTRGSARAKEIKPLESEISSQSFISYEPACKRKLDCFPDKECLLQVLGNDSKKLQDWEPDDRVIDASGHVYRLVYRPQNKWYDIEPTDETWDYPKLLELAIEDAQIIKKDSRALRDRVDRAPDVEKITVIMQCVDDPPAAARWVMIGFFLFLILFALAVFFGTAFLFLWLQNRF